jgi:hypothetical protein
VTRLTIAAAALLIAIVGAGLRARSQAAAEAATDTGTLGGITAALHGAGWVAMDGHSMGDQGGYQMPAQMMPGAPEGDDMRLGIRLTLTNTSQDPRQFNLADEFALGGGRTGAPRLLHSDTFGSLSRLNPGSAVDGVLYFDTVVPSHDDPPFYLLWKRGGNSAQLAVWIGVEGPAHEHSPS